MVERGDAVELRVAGARKRDAGRGIARLPEAARRHLGVLSGDPVILEGDTPTVAKVWPGEVAEPVVRIDAETRDNAGVTIGDTVLVRGAHVDAAAAIILQPASDETDHDPSHRTVARRLQDRLVRAGERVRVGDFGRYYVVETKPDGSVRVEEETSVTVEPTVAEEPPEPLDSGSVVTPPDLAADEEHPDEGGGTTYEDIGGLDQELDLVREMIELPLAEPEVFDRLGIDPPSGVLLHGPPGTGKTLIARAVANEVDASFEVISGPEIVSKYKGESAERLRSAFERARENAPSILFVDEIDSIAGARDEEADMENRVVAQLLTLMDGLETSGEVVVIGATNRVDTIDPALRRGGRFDREIEIGVPNTAGRREILAVHTRGMPLGDGVDPDRLAARTHGFVGADLASLVREAALSALRRRERDAAGVGTGSGEFADVEPGADAACRDQPASSGDTDTDVASEGQDAAPSDGNLRVTRADFETALAAVEPSAMREYVAEQPSVTFADVGGLDEPKARLRETVEWPLSYAPLFEASATEPPAGVLLYGPPGTGKTLLGRATAGETGVNFIQVAGPELVDRYIGESEKAVRELFERARQTAPTVVFIDELDAIAGRRGRGDEVGERVVSQLLAELDAAAENPSVVVLAATNRKAILDPALLRPGRLEEHVLVPEPDERARREILEVHARGKPLAADVDLETVAAEAADFSGAELEALLREASLRAIRGVAADIDPDNAAAHADEVTVTQAHLSAARERLESTEETE